MRLNTTPYLPKLGGKSVTRIPIKCVVPNPSQPRRYFDEEMLAELAESIKQVGLLQPVVVRRVGKEAYEIVAGERRMRACRLAGLGYVDALIITADDNESAVIALVENLQRENLHYMEEAEAYLALICDHGMTQEELARGLGRSQSSVANKLRILRMPGGVKQKILEYNLTERHARALLRLPDEKAQLMVIEAIVERHLNVKSTEELIERLQEGKPQLEKAPPEKPLAKRTLPIVGDARLYLNSIQQIVRQMNDAGFKPDYKMERSDAGIEVRISIPAKAV